MEDERKLSLPIKDFCDFIERNIAKRKETREAANNESSNTVLVGSKLVTSKCAAVNNFDKHIQRHLAVRQKFLDSEIADVHSHGSVQRKHTTSAQSILKV